MTAMDLGEPLRAMVAYSEHADGIVLAAIDGLSDDELDAKHGASWDSIRATMRHMVTAQNVWLQRFGAAAAPVSEDLRADFEASHAALREFTLGCSADDFARDINYVDSRGAAFSIPLWQLMLHVCNHGTHHRAEVGMLLGQLGRSPGDIDFVYHKLGKF